MIPIKNILLEGLPKKTLTRIMNNCEQVELTFGTVLCEANKMLTFIYFPLSGFISQVTVLQEHHPLEMGLIGNEGMLGATLALGLETAPMRALVQGAGSALRMTRLQLALELRKSPDLLGIIHRYLYMMMVQLVQTGACMHFHEIEPRLARWLLMSHDRAHADHFHLTQEFLANMLGVRRSGVTVAAGILQNKKLIHYSRGDIHIMNRAGLEKAACTCYAEMIKIMSKVSNN